MTCRGLPRPFARRGAAMEPAEDRPDDQRAVPGGDRHGDAAMEPAEDRPDDPSGLPGPLAARMPQWSRPRIGRMTPTVRHSPALR